MLPKLEMSGRKGLAVGVAGACAFSLMALFVRVARDDYTTSQLLFARAISGILILSWLCREEIPGLFNKHARFVWLRAIFGGVSVACYYWNLRRASLGSATILADLAPVIVVLLSSVQLRAAPSRRVTAGVMLAFFGVVILSTPNASALSGASLMVGLIGAFSGALAYLSLKQATAKYSAGFVVLAFSVALLVISCLDYEAFTLAQVNRSKWPILGVVVCSLLAQVLMTVSYRSLSVVAASTVSLTAVLWAIFFDVVFIGLSVTAAFVASTVFVLLGIWLTLGPQVAGNRSTYNLSENSQNY